MRTRTPSWRSACPPEPLRTVYKSSTLLELGKGPVHQLRVKPLHALYR